MLSEVPASVSALRALHHLSFLLSSSPLPPSVPLRRIGDSARPDHVCSNTQLLSFGPVLLCLSSASSDMDPQLVSVDRSSGGVPSGVLGVSLPLVWFSRASLVVGAASSLVCRHDRLCRAHLDFSYLLSSHTSLLFLSLMYVVVRQAGTKTSVVHPRDAHFSVFPFLLALFIWSLYAICFNLLLLCVTATLPNPSFMQFANCFPQNTHSLSNLHHWLCFLSSNADNVLKLHPNVSHSRPSECSPRIPRQSFLSSPQISPCVAGRHPRLLRVHDYPAVAASPRTPHPSPLTAEWIRACVPSSPSSLSTSRIHSVDPLLSLP